MSRHIDYKCSRCNREVGKSNLKVKQARFKEMGNGGAVIASRVSAWLCIIPQDDGSLSCLHSDVDWQRPLYATSPGMADTNLARQNSA
jgi:hypothetical protein